MPLETWQNNRGQSKITSWDGNTLWTLSNCSSFCLSEPDRKFRPAQSVLFFQNNDFCFCRTEMHKHSLARKGLKNVLHFGFCHDAFIRWRWKLRRILHTRSNSSNPSQSNTEKISWKFCKVVWMIGVSKVMKIHYSERRKDPSGVGRSASMIQYRYRWSNILPLQNFHTALWNSRTPGKIEIESSSWSWWVQDVIFHNFYFWHVVPGCTVTEITKLSP